MTPETSRELRGRFSSFLNQELVGPIRETYLKLLAWKNRAIGYLGLGKDNPMAVQRAESPDPRMTPQQDAGRRTLIQEGIARRRRNTRIELALSSLFLTGVLAIGAYAWLTEQLETSADVNSPNNIRPAVTAPAPAIFAPLPTATFAPTETATAILIPTPEPSLTWTPIPTPRPTEMFTPTPEPTKEPTLKLEPKPLYAECGENPRRIEPGSRGEAIIVPLGLDGKGLPTGAGREKRFQYFTLLSAYSCLTEVKGYTTLIEPNDAILVTMAVFDTDGNKYEYPAIFGGARLQGKPVKVSLGENGVNRIIPLKDAYQRLTDLANSKDRAKILNSEFVLYDFGAPWPGEAMDGRINQFAETHRALAEALKTGEGFPEIPDGFFIYIWQTYILEESPWLDVPD